MALPLTDSALVGTCLAFAALGLVAMTSGSPAPAPAPVVAAAPTAPAPVVDDAFGAQVRAYLMANPEVIFEAVAEYERRNVAAQADMDQALIDLHADALFNDGHSWEGGNPEGDIVLVEFMDYKCGFCKRAHAEVKGFVRDDGNVRLILKEFPILGPESELASRFAIAVHQVGGNDAYARAHDALMTTNDAITPEVLDRIAQDTDFRDEYRIHPRLRARRWPGRNCRKPARLGQARQKPRAVLRNPARAHPIAHRTHAPESRQASGAGGSDGGCLGRAVEADPCGSPWRRCRPAGRAVKADRLRIRSGAVSCGRRLGPMSAQASRDAGTRGGL